MASKGPWPIQKLRGAGAPKIVEYVIEAEFDIDTGSTVRYQYPSEVPNYKPDWFAEHMLPEGAHNRVLDYTYVFLNRTGSHVDTYNWIKPESEFSAASLLASSVGDKDEQPFLYGLNLVKTRHDSTVRRGAIVKAMCIFSRYSFIEAFKKPLELALDEFFDNQSMNVLQKLYDQLNAIDVGALPAPTLLEQQLMRRGVHYDTIRPALPDHLPRSWIQTIECPSAQGPLSLPYPLYQTPDEVGDISVSRLVKVFGEATMKIYHGILTKQRVLFVGYGHSAHDIAQMVLSSVAMVAPPLTNIIRRTYPYANLTDLTFLETKGYIAGVTNPMFQQRESWWDVLCVLDLPNNTGTVITAEDKKESTTSKSGGSNASGNSSSNSGGSGNSNGMHHSVSASTLAAATDTADVTLGGLGSAYPSRANLTANEEKQLHIAVDTRFIQGVVSGINALFGEEWVRQQFADYTGNLLTFIQDKNMLLHMSRLDDRTRHVAEANLQRLTILEGSSEFKDLPKHPWVWDKQSTDASSVSVANPAAAAVTVATTSSGSNTAPASPERNRSTTPVPPAGDGIATSSIASAAVPPVPPGPLPPMGNRSRNTSSSSLPVSANSSTSSMTQVGPPSVSLLSAASMFNPLSLKTKLLRLRLDQSVTFTREMETHLLMAEKYLVSEVAMQGLVILFPESQGGLTPFAAGMFHASPIIRYCTLKLLNRIRVYPSTKAAFEGMNTFVLAGHQRLQEKWDAGGKDDMDAYFGGSEDVV